MKIGLIDVDGHRWPNLALMKLSARGRAALEDLPLQEVKKGGYDGRSAAG